MIMGGIPFYMNFFNPSYSLAQNIDALSLPVMRSWGMSLTGFSILCLIMPKTV